jgi:hypothetical protein
MQPCSSFTIHVEIAFLIKIFLVGSPLWGISGAKEILEQKTTTKAKSKFLRLASYLHQSICNHID